MIVFSISFMKFRWGGHGKNAVADRPGKQTDRQTKAVIDRYYRGDSFELPHRALCFMMPWRTYNCCCGPFCHNLSQAGTGLTALLFNNLAELPTEFMDVMFCRITHDMIMYIVNRHEIMQPLFITIGTHYMLNSVCFHICLFFGWNVRMLPEGMLLHAAVASLNQMPFPCMYQFPFAKWRQM